MIAQGTPEWFAKRSKRITASRLGDVIASPKTKRYRNYKAELLCNLQGAPHMEDDKPWFLHGKILEPIALGRYEFEMLLRGEDIEVAPGGFDIHPEYDFIGSSPDGKIAPKASIEIKSSISHSNYEKMAKKGLPTNHKPQVQGQLWIGGYDWADFILFFRDPDGLMQDEITITRVYPDLDYHEMLKEKCLDFWAEIMAELKAA